MAVPNGTATEPGKIFVGGLSWDTTKESLQSYFGQYGDVTDSVIMQDATTGKPRGFGFVTFASEEAVALVANSGPHTIDNKTVDPKRATMKGYSHQQQPQQQLQQQPQQQQQQQQRYPDPNLECSKKKIFVGGLNLDSTEDDVKEYFSQYGTVTEVDLKKDKATDRKRGFGFVTFVNEETVEKVIQIHFHQINGKTVEAKKAEARQSGQQRPHQGTPGTAVYAAYGQYGTQAAAAAAYGAGGNTARPGGGGGYYPYHQHGYQYYNYQWPYGSSGQQQSTGQSMATTGYTGQEGHAMYTQTAGAEGYGAQTPSYSYDNSRGVVPPQTQTAAASYTQQAYGETSANYGSAMAQHSAQQQQQPRNYYNN